MGFGGMRSLRTVMTAAALAGLLALNGTLAAMLWGERQAARDQTAVRVQTATATVLSQAGVALNVVDRTLSGIGEALRLYPHAEQRGDHGVHTLLVRRHAMTPHLRAMIVIGPDGALMHDSVNADPPALDFSDRDYWNALNGGAIEKLFVGNPVRSRIDGSWVIPMARREDDQFGSLRFVLAAGIAPEQFQELLDAQNLGPGSRAVVLNSQGRTVACLGLAPDCLYRADLAALRRELATQPGDAQDVAWLPGAEGPASWAIDPDHGFMVVVNGDGGAGWLDRLPLYLTLSAAGSLALCGLFAALYRQVLHRRAALRALEQVNRGLEDAVECRTRELAENETRLRLILETARDAVVVIDGQGIIHEINPACEQLFGYDPDELLGCSVNQMMPEHYGREHDRLIQRPHNTNGLVGNGREMMGKRKDGSVFPIELTVGTGERDGVRMHVGVIRDITERKMAEAELHRLATTDGLTGVLNRRHFMEEAGKAFELARRHGRPLAVVMLDADRFKSVNDTYGHAVGDDVLKALARCLSGLTRSSDLLGRLGGEEFAVLLPETDAEGARLWCQRALEEVRGLMVPLQQGGVLGFTVSLGLARLEHDSAGLDHLMRLADEALYQAKTQGRDRMVEAGAAVPA